MEVESLARAPVAGERIEEEKALELKPTYKSWKKKYRKMRVKFDITMDESNALYKQEQDALETARRLALETDSLLDLLLDVNDSQQIPGQQRIDLSLETPSLSAVPPLINDTIPDPEIVCNTPRGQVAYTALRRILDSKLRAKLASKPTKSLASLMASTPHHPFTITAMPPDPSSVSGLRINVAEDLAVQIKDSSPTRTANPISYLSPAHFDAQLSVLDASLNLPPGPTVHNSSPQPVPLHLEDKDIAVRNPVSVYNWLRRHEPKIFLQDGESQALSEKNLVKPGALRGAGKRASIPVSVKMDAVEFVEEDGLGYDVSLSGSRETYGRRSSSGAGWGGKRKRAVDEDAGYKPKSSGSRPAKKKRKDSGGEYMGTVRGSSSSKVKVEKDADADEVLKDGIEVSVA